MIGLFLLDHHLIGLAIIVRQKRLYIALVIRAIPNVVRLNMC